MQQEIDDIFEQKTKESEEEDEDDDKERGRRRGRRERRERDQDDNGSDGVTKSTYTTPTGKGLPQLHADGAGGTKLGDDKSVDSLQAYLTKHHGAPSVRGKGDVRVYEYGDPVPYVGNKGGLALLQGLEIGKAGAGAADRMVLCGSLIFTLEGKTYMIVGLVYHGKPLVERTGKRKKEKPSARGDFLCGQYV